LGVSSHCCLSLLNYLLESEDPLGPDVVSLYALKNDLKTGMEFDLKSPAMALKMKLILNINNDGETIIL
jgi:hypothetical protein